MSSSSEKEGSSPDRPKEEPEINLKHDWYQTEQQVVLQLLVKNVGGDKVKVEFTQKAVDVDVHLDDGAVFKKTWVLAHDIIPERCFHKTTPLKIEIRLAKAEGNHWSELEIKQDDKKIAFGRNWDKVVSEIEEEAPEGEAALNALFQKIYAEGSDEVKKAMNKSFMESGGTELNTNWDAVSKDRVSIKPPDGMEWKSWEQ